jgi:hypothetical protein
MVKLQKVKNVAIKQAMGNVEATKEKKVKDGYDHMTIHQM